MHLQSDKKKVTVWLAKVPKYIGEKIMGLRAGSKIGSIKIDQAQLGVICNIHFNDNVVSEGIPKEHKIQIKDRNTNMYLVSDDKNKMAIEGNVNKECFVTPVLNAEYLKYKKFLKVKEGKVKDKVQVLDYFDEMRKVTKYSTLREMDILARQRKQMLQDKKRERLDKDDVLEIIFSAYERRSLWTVKDLADFSGQPVAYIQELVNEVCNLNKSDHKNTYELKAEFRQ